MLKASTPHVVVRLKYRLSHGTGRYFNHCSDVNLANVVLSTLYTGSSSFILSLFERENLHSLEAPAHWRIRFLNILDCRWQVSRMKVPLVLTVICENPSQCFCRSSVTPFFQPPLSRKNSFPLLLEAEKSVMSCFLLY